MNKRNVIQTALATAALSALVGGAMGAKSAHAAATITVDTTTKLTAALNVYLPNTMQQFFTLNAGAFDVTYVNDGSQLGSFPQFPGYCVEVEQPVAPGGGDVGTYDVTTKATQNASPLLLSGQAARIGFLYQINAFTVSSITDALGLQLAIWEVRYDGNAAGNFFSGNFQYTDGAPTINAYDGGGATSATAIRARASAYLAAAPVGSQGAAIIFQNPDRQDIVGPIPEPGTVALFASGVLPAALGALRLRRRRRH